MKAENSAETSVAIEQAKRASHLWRLVSQTLHLWNFSPCNIGYRFTVWDVAIYSL